MRVSKIRLAFFVMKIQGLMPALCLSLITCGAPQAAELRAQVSPDAGAPPVPSLRIFTDNTPLGKIDRGVLQCGTDQFSFVVPEDFLVKIDPIARQVCLVSTDLQATMIIAVLPTPQKSGAGVSASSLCAQARTDYPGATVVDQFEVTVANWRGPAIEVEWPAKKSSVRIAHVPFPNGVLAFTVQAPAGHIRACDHSLNQLLLSIRAGLNSRSPDFQQFLPDL